MMRIIGWIVVGLITMANAGYLGYSLTAAGGSTVNKKLSLSTIDVKSAKQHDVDTTQFGVKAETSFYKFDRFKKSKIVSETPGKLVLATQKSENANFILATNDKVTFDESKINSAWTTTTVADDPLWAPGACSAKPTLLLQGKYIFIDDGKTKPTDTYNSYVVYDISKGTYSYFGGDNFSDVQGKRQKILFATNENNQLVFYIDELDKKGPLSNTTSFKHAAGSSNGYLIRRVVDPATMKYTDFHLNYKVPEGIQFFYLAAYVDTINNRVNISMTQEATQIEPEVYNGNVVNNAIMLKREAPYNPNISVQQANLDSPFEKELEGPLSQLLPKYAAEKLYDTNVYSTHYAVNSLGAHSNLTYATVSNRANEAYVSPLVYDKSTKQASVLTNQEFLNSQNFVALGVF